MLSRRRRDNPVVLHPRGENMRGGGGAILALILVGIFIIASAFAFWQLYQLTNR